MIKDAGVKMNKKTQNTNNDDIVTLVFQHIFLANMFPHGILIGLIFAGPIALICMGNMVVFYIVMAIVLLARVVFLPIIYDHMEKNSKSEAVKNFIYNLKNNWKFRIKLILSWDLLAVLFLSSSFFVKLFTAFPSNFNLNIIPEFVNIVLFVIAFNIFFDPVGSYVALFVWWKIRGELR